jgi:hypothetical protein
MTDFVIFLAMCAGFSFLLWRFIRPSEKRGVAERDRRVTESLVTETAELTRMTARAKSSAGTGATQPPPSGGFGRKPQPSEDQHKVADILKNPVELYDGLFTLTPFGHDILKPPSRTVPEPFRGRWVKASLQHEARPELLDSAAVFEVGATELKVRGRVEPVVAVESGQENFKGSELPDIAIVSESVFENGKWAFSLIMLALQQGGQRLVDVESMDSPWVRMADA